MVRPNARTNERTIEMFREVSGQSPDNAAPPLKTLLKFYITQKVDKRQRRYSKKILNGIVHDFDLNSF